MPKKTLDFVEFNEDQDALFLKHCKECCDLFDDADYVRWLGIRHPEVLPTHSNVSLLNNHDDIGGLSVVAHLSFISLQIPLLTADSGFNLSSDLTSHILSNERGCITNISESISILDYQETTPEMQTQNAKSSRHEKIPHVRFLTRALSLAKWRRKKRNKRNSKKVRKKKKEMRKSNNYNYN